jgi:tricorn protease
MEMDVGGFSRPTNSAVYLAVLAKATPSPFAPESDDEKPRDESNKGDSQSKETGHIDLEGIGQRILATPMQSRYYINLEAGASGALFAVEGQWPTPEGEETVTVHRFDLARRKVDVALSGVKGFCVSFSGDKMLYPKNGSCPFVFGEK